MSAASMMTLLGKLPVPLFGTARVAATFGMKKAKAAPLAWGWAFPAAVGAGWFIWPAVTDDFKISIGLMDDPEGPPPPAKPVELDDTAKAAIAVAHKVDASTGEEPTPPTEEELQVEKQYLAGDYSGLEKDWGEFMEKAIKPGEDDDDDDDDDEDDDEEDDDDDDDDDDE